MQTGVGVSVPTKVDLFVLGSFGGHFEQLLGMRAAWVGKTALYITTRVGEVEALDGEHLAFVTDCHGRQFFRAAACLAQMARLVIRHEPACIVTTGALPGLIAAWVGRFFAVPVIWVDSFANSETLSLSGRHARLPASVHLTQWPQVASREGSAYLGSMF